MVKISNAVCPGLSPAFSAQFIFNMCATVQNPGFKVVQGY